MNSFLNFPKTYDDHLKEVEQREEEQVEENKMCNEIKDGKQFKHDCKLFNINQIKTKTMKVIIRENTWTPRGGFMDFGWGNGYVLIPKGHPLHGKEYDNID